LPAYDSRSPRYRQRDDCTSFTRRAIVYLKEGDARSQSYVSDQGICILVLHEEALPRPLPGAERGADQNPLLLPRGRPREGAGGGYFPVTDLGRRRHYRYGRAPGSGLGVVTPVVPVARGAGSGFAGLPVVLAGGLAPGMGAAVP
jgi:hypothetical protein